MSAETMTTEEGRKRMADQLRKLADEIEGGRWGSVGVSIDNHHRDKPRTWHDGGMYRGVDLVGKTVRVDLSLPASVKLKQERG